MSLGSQLRAGPTARQRSQNPLVRDGVELLPSLTHVVDRTQRMYFYYEVYEPLAAVAVGAAQDELAFYRGGVKVFETPVVERTDLTRRIGVRRCFSSRSRRSSSSPASTSAR